MHARPTRRLGAAVAALALLAAGACGDDADDDATPVPPVEEPGADDPSDDLAEPVEPADPAEGDRLTIADFALPEAEVGAGEEVTVINDDGVPHTLTADEGEFDTGTIEAGGEGTFAAPDEPGSYAVHCEIHEQMRATLTVT